MPYESYGEEVLKAFLKKMESNLEFERIPGMGEPDFFLKRDGEVVAVCEVKDLEDTHDLWLVLSSDELEGLTDLEKRKDFLAARPELTEAERAELESIRRKENEIFEKNNAHSEKLEKGHRSKIQSQYDKGVEQLMRRREPKVLALVSFRMTDIIDLARYVAEPQWKDGGLDLPDLVIFMNVHEPVQKAGIIEVTKFDLVALTELGERVRAEHLLVLPADLVLPVKLNVDRCNT